MTKIMQMLNFNNNSYQFDTLIDPNPVKEKKQFHGDAAALSASASKRSALSASDAECFSLCLGAGPLCHYSPLFPYFMPLFDRLFCSGGPDVPATDSAPPGGVSGGAASPATPSTPTHDDNNHDLLSALLWASASSLCGSAESLSEPVSPAPPAPRPQDLQRRDQVINAILERKDKQPVKVEFKIYLTENTCTRWEAVVSGSTLYLRVPTVLSGGSKESFMLLLDFVEERLGCNSCIICVLKSRGDRATLLRTFMFLGFQLLAPGSALLPPEINNPDYMFLHYNMA